MLVQSKRKRHAALKSVRKLLRNYALVSERLVTDDLRSYGAATLDLGIGHLHERRAVEEQSCREFASADPPASRERYEREFENMRRKREQDPAIEAAAARRLAAEEEAIARRYGMCPG